jgi:hypothetical protein
VVEFQPSGFGKGSYLNVAAHFLWGPFPEKLSFDFIKGPKLFITYDDDAQFSSLARNLAQQAVTQIREIENLLGDIHRSAAALTAAQNEPETPGWPAFNAAIAAGLSGEMAKARNLFDAAYNAIIAWRPEFRTHLAPYKSAIKDETNFVNFITAGINVGRNRYKLKALGSGASL